MGSSSSTKKRDKNHERHKTRKARVMVPLVYNKIKPGNDFYLYVNKNWLINAEMPPSESSFGVSEEIENHIRSRLLGYIKNIINSSNLTSSHERTVATFFKSGFYSNRHKDHDRTFKKILSSYDCMKNAEDVMASMGKLIRCNVPTHLSIYLGRDLKNPRRIVPVLSTGSLSLPDISYYEGTGPGGSNIIESFQTFLQNLGKHLDYNELGRIANLESTAVEHYHLAQTEDPTMVTGSILAKKFKYIPWSSFWNSYGLTDNQWKNMHIMNRCNKWLAWINSQLKTCIISDWANWFRVQTALYFGPYVPSPIDDMYFNFFGNKLRGDKIKMSQENLLYNSASFLLQPSLSYMYKKCCLTDAHQKSVKHFVSKISSSAIKRVDNLDWLSEKSKQLTKDKIKKIRLEITDVDPGTHYKSPLKVMSEIDIVHNILICGEVLTIRDIYYITHQSQSPPPNDAVYEVNAHYYISGNRLVIPGGITLWPFYDSTKGSMPGWCFGGLGAVVGHEMLHAFDEDGKDFDPNGIYKPWWSSRDMEAYSKKINALIKLFGNTKFLGRYVNGRNTVSENIADLGGLSIALDALKRHLDEININGEKRKKEIRDFFISYAVSWRTKERKQRSVYRLFTDVHAPAPLRVNLIVSQFQDFYDAFNIQPGDNMYIDPKNRISIF